MNLFPVYIVALTVILNRAIINYDEKQATLFEKRSFSMRQGFSPSFWISNSSWSTNTSNRRINKIFFKLFFPKPSRPFTRSMGRKSSRTLGNTKLLRLFIKKCLQTTWFSSLFDRISLGRPLHGQGNVLQTFSNSLQELFQKLIFFLKFSKKWTSFPGRLTCSRFSRLTMYSMTFLWTYKNHSL